MLTRIELPAAVVLAFSASFAPWWLPYLIGAQILLHVIVMLTAARSREQASFDPLLGLLGVIALTSIAIAVLPHTTPMALRLMSGAGLFHAVLRIPQTGATLRWLAIGFGILALLSAGAGLAGIANPWLAGAAHEIAAAPLFVPLCIAALSASTIDDLSPLVRLLHGTAAVGGIAAAALTPHTELLPILIVGASMAIVLSLRPTLLRLTPIALSALTTILVLLPILPHSWTNSLFTWQSAEIVNETREAWDRAIYLISSFPITGVGPGAFAAVTDALYPLTTATTATDACNLLLQIAAELGIPGALVIVVLIARSVRTITSQRFTANWLIIGALSSLTTILAYGLTHIPIWGTLPLGPALWFFIGAAVRFSTTPAKS